MSGWTTGTTAQNIGEKCILFRCVRQAREDLPEILDQEEFWARKVLQDHQVSVTYKCPIHENQNRNSCSEANLSCISTFQETRYVRDLSSVLSNTIGNFLLVVRTCVSFSKCLLFLGPDGVPGNDDTTLAGPPGPPGPPGRDGNPG
jgi:hypothetical protein